MFLDDIWPWVVLAFAILLFLTIVPAVIVWFQRYKLFFSVIDTPGGCTIKLFTAAIYGFP